MHKVAPWVAGLCLAGASCEQLPPTVTLDMTASVEANTVEIRGTTDLPEGAYLAYEVEHEAFEYDTETPEEMLFTEGTFEVVDGRFGGTVDLSQFDSGPITVLVAFQMNLSAGTVQPRRIRSRFGEQGELLEGPNVSSTQTGDLRVATTQAIER